MKIFRGSIECRCSRDRGRGESYTVKERKMLGSVEENYKEILVRTKKAL